MKIAKVETVACDAGWRNYNFLKITAENGLVGWSEYDELYGPPGLTEVIHRFGQRVIGGRINDHERVYGALAATIRPAPYGMTAEALGAIENALIDIKAKALGVPCYELLGGKHRDAIPVYWSHCATWRINFPDHYGPSIDDLDGVRKAGSHVREKGFKAAKTNLFVHGNDRPRQWMAGFGAPYEPGLNIDRKLINSVRTHLEALRDGVGPDVELMIDFNFNARTEGFLKLIRALSDIDFLWFEMDIYNPEALAFIRQQSSSPISSLETLFGVRQYLPYFQAQAVDVAIIDVVWNGIWQSMKIANTAEAFDVNIAPHNFYSHLATMMSVHFAAAVPNLRIMEHDVDRLAWDDELFIGCPVIKDGSIVVPDRPGWGCEPNEGALAKHPPKTHGGYLEG